MPRTSKPAGKRRTVPWVSVGGLLCVAALAMAGCSGGASPECATALQLYDLERARDNERYAIESAEASRQYALKLEEARRDAEALGQLPKAVYPPRTAQPPSGYVVAAYQQVEANCPLDLIPGS